MNMTKIAEKVLKIGAHHSIIFEFAFSPWNWVVWPALIYFPPGSPGRLGCADTDCKDWTFAWLRFGVTYRIQK